MNQQDMSKRLAGRAAAELVQDGMQIGLGTGSTIFFTIERLVERMRTQGLRTACIPTSEQSRQLAEDGGIPILTFAQTTVLDLVIDGADEIDPQLSLIKGGGGALLREKLVALAGKRFIIVADNSKQVETLGHFPLPVEIVPFGHEGTLRRLQEQGAFPELRMDGYAPYVTDNGNYIARCHFGRIENPAALHDSLKRVSGVVETGLFVGMTEQAILSNGVDVWSVSGR